MKKQRVFQLLTLVLLAGLTGFLIYRFAKPDSAGSIKITAIVPLSGSFTKVGQPKKEGIELAIRHINLQGGVNGRQVEAEFIDSKGTPTDGLNAFQQSLNTKRANAYFIDLTPIAGACIPVATDNRVVTFFGTAHPTLVSDSPWAFRVFASGAQEASVLLESLKKTSVTNVFVLRVGDSYGQGLFDVFSKLSSAARVNIVGSETFEIGQQDVKGIIEKAKSAAVDRVVIMDYGVTLPTLLTAASESGIEPSSIVCNIGFVGTPAPSKLAPSIINGIVFVAPAFALGVQTRSSQPGAATFRKDFEAAYGAPPGHTAAYAYDAVQAIVNGMRIAKSSEPESVRKALSELPPFEGASGKVQLLGDGDCITEMTLATVKEGKLVPLSN